MMRYTRLETTEPSRSKPMTELRTFLVSQAGKPIASVEASSVEASISRAKGLGHILDFSPSLPMDACEVALPPDSVPSFSNDYFELLGFVK